MENDPTLFPGEGTSVSIEGNNPFLIGDPGSVWLVDGGKIVLFLVSVRDQEVTGRRLYLLELSSGEVFFGIEPLENGNRYAILATGWTGTHLRQFSRSHFFNLIEQDAEKTTRMASVFRWATELARAVHLSVHPDVQVLPSGEPGVRLDRPDGDGQPMSLDAFHHEVFQMGIEQYQLHEKEENARLPEKKKHDQLVMSQAVGRLAAVIQPETRCRVEEEISDNPLLQACQIVGKAMKIRVVSRRDAQRRSCSPDPLGDIARDSQFRIRKVALKGDWWKADNGPLLGYLDEGDRPVALVPVGPTRYELHDPSRDTVTVVTRTVAKLVKLFAYIFYRPFPHQILTLRDIITFAIDACWKKDLWSVFLMGILGGILTMVIPIATGIVFETVIPDGERNQLLQIAFFLGVSAVVGVIFQIIRSISILRLEGKVEGSMLPAVWDRLLSLPAPFFKKYSSGELAMRAMGVSQIRDILSGTMATTIISGIFSIFNLGLMFYYNVQLAGIALLLVILATAVTIFLGFRHIVFERKVVDYSNHITGLVFQLISGIAKFRVAGAEKRAFFQWSREFSEQRKIAYQGATYSNWMSTFNSFFPVMASIAIFFVVVRSGNLLLSAGAFIAFQAAFLTLTDAVSSLSGAVLSMNVVIPLYERSKLIFETLPEYDEIKEEPGELTGAIEVSHVSFRYEDGGPLVLKDVSLQVKEGEYLGLVGPSGSGKSTLFRILLSFEKPERGKVYYNGHDLESLDIRAVRRQLGVVIQNGQLLAGDILSNIIGANPNLTLDDALEAAKLVGLYQDIEEMPMGMFTLVSEGGSTLSGGQRQRILIARAIVNKPKILFFDEATSSLDNRTQAIVSESLGRLKATRVVIAHRLSTIQRCDRILVLDQGRIVEVGTYDELMRKNGLFADLAKRQLA